MSNHTSNSSVLDPGLREIHLSTAVVLSLLAALGFMGNTMVVVTIIRMAQLHRIAYFLVGNMSVVGLLTCVVAIPLHVAHITVSPTMWEGRSQSLCKTQAHVNFGLILSTLANCTAISAFRFQAVCVMYNVRSSITSKATIKLIFFIWALPVLVAFSASPFLGFNELISDCFFVDLAESFWFMNIALATPALISVVSMLIFYGLIIKKVRDSHRKIANFHHKSRHKSDGRQSSKAESASESRNEASSVSQYQSDASPNNMGGITVFTTMTSNEPIDAPSTSYAPAKNAPKLAESQILNSASCVAMPADIPQSLTHLKLPRSGPPSRQNSSTTNAVESMEMFSTASGNSSSVGGQSDRGVGRKLRHRSKRGRWLRKELSLISHLMVNFLFFGLFCVPFCLVHLIHAASPVGKDTWLILYALCLSFGSNTWIMYALLNLKIRRAIKAFLLGRRSF